MSEISNNLISSLSQIIGNDVVDKLKGYDLFETALNDEALSTINGAQDAETLEAEELLEIIVALQGQLENTDNNDEIDAINAAINAINASLDDVAVDEDQEVDIDGEVAQLGDYLDVSENQDALINGGFAALDDIDLQVSILQYFHQTNQPEVMEKLLVQLSPEDSSDIIVAGAELP